MKSIIFLCSFAAMTSIASTECYTPQIARDAIRAIALVSHREMITDLVGGAIDSGEQSTYSIWANFCKVLRLNSSYCDAKMFYLE